MKSSAQYYALAKTYRSRLQALVSRIPYKKSVVFLQKRPFVSFFLALGMLLALIIIGNVIRGINKKAPTQPEITKTVQTYTIGKSPSITVQAKIEKSGVVKILAQTSGIVDSVIVSEGQAVNRGTGVVSLASTYSGASAPGIQAQLAKTQYQNVLDTYDTQKQSVALQKELAETNRENTEQLRIIAERSIGDTQELLRYNETMLNLVNQSIGNTPSDSQVGQFGNPLQQSRAQLLATVVQVRAQLRGLEQQIDTNRAPNKLSNIQRDLAIKQLSIQEKAIDLQKESARLSSALAGIHESLMRPASPFNGVVQRMYVRPGQSVNPGTPIATVSQSNHPITAVATVPFVIAQSIATGDSSTLMIGKKKLSLKPDFVSTDATDGQLYSVKYTIPDEYEQSVTDGQTVSVSIPVGSAPTGTASPFVPLDSVYQTQTESFVYTIQGDKAVAKKIMLGNVFGRFVEVESGLGAGETIILSRNVIENDHVRSL